LIESDHFSFGRPPDRLSLVDMGTPPSDAQSSEPTHVRFIVLGFICALSLLTYLDRVCIMRVSSMMSEELGFDTSGIQMGAVFSAFLLGYALFEVPSGWMGDVWGPRRVLTRIVLWWSAFTVLTGCVFSFEVSSAHQFVLFGYSIISSFGLLMAVRFFFGAGEAGAYPNITRVTGVWFPVRERAVAQGAVWMAARLGGALAPPVMGALSSSTRFGWRGAFWILGGLGLIWAAAFRLWFRDRPGDSPHCNAAERSLIRDDNPSFRPAKASNSGSFGHREPAEETGFTPAGSIQSASDPSFKSASVSGEVHANQPGNQAADPNPEESSHHAMPPIGTLLSSVTVWAMAVAAFAVCFGWYFYPTWQPKYLQEAFGIPYENSEFLTGLPFLCGAAGAILGGWLSDRLVVRTGSRRWGRSLVGLVGFSGAGLCVLGTGFATQPWQAVTLLCLAFFINDLAIPTLWASFADVGGRFVGTLSGLMNMIGAIGGGLAPVLIPIVLKQFDHLPTTVRWQYIFSGMASAWFIAAAAWLFIDAGKPLAKRH
jgi:MFS family permease